MRSGAREILERVAAKEKHDRKRESIYVSKRIYSEFKATCGHLPISSVLEALMEDFVADVRAQTSEPRDVRRPR